MRLGDVAKVCRTKNAGAFRMTMDVLFEDARWFEAASDQLTPSAIAHLYSVDPKDVLITRWDEFMAIKATIPRWWPSGSPGDRDVYGCQQHAPLLEFTLS